MYLSCTVWVLTTIVGILTGRGQSLLLLFEVLIVFLAAVVPKVTKDFYCSQPILFEGESTQHFCPGIQNGIYFLSLHSHLLHLS